MHEIGYCESLLPVVEARAQGRPVARVRVRAGAVHRLVPDSFQQAFDMVAAGTVAADARTELVTVPLQVQCATCDQATDSTDALSACPACGGVDVTHSGGDEFTLEQVEYRESSPRVP